VTPEEQKAYDRGYEAGTVNYVHGEELFVLRELAEAAQVFVRAWNRGELTPIESRELEVKLGDWRKLKDRKDGK